MLPLLALVVLACVQACLLALGVTFAQVAVDRSARGESPSQVRSSIPSAWRRGADVSTTPSAHVVRLRAPSVLPGAGRFLVVRAARERAS